MEEAQVVGLTSVGHCNVAILFAGGAEVAVGLELDGLTSACHGILRPLQAAFSPMEYGSVLASYQAAAGLNRTTRYESVLKVTVPREAPV